MEERYIILVSADKYKTLEKFYNSHATGNLINYLFLPKNIN